MVGPSASSALGSSRAVVLSLEKSSAVTAEWLRAKPLVGNTALTPMA